jgi:hypothetical protein
VNFFNAPAEVHQNPIALCQWMWPHDIFWSKSCDIIMAVKESAVTYIQAGNELGKDWTLGRIALSAFVAPWAYYGPEWFRNIDQFARPEDPEWISHSRRVITTSVKDQHLNVLWGEIGTAWRTCAINLDERFVMTHHEIRFRQEAEQKNVASYLTGIVSGQENMEGLTGHHAKYTFAFGDEASGLDDRVQDAVSGWAKREVWIGNPLPCNTYYKKGCKAGDLLMHPDGTVADEPVMV